MYMVGPAGLEPARPYGQQILSLQRLPFRHGPRCFYMMRVVRLVVALSKAISIHKGMALLFQANIVRNHQKLC